MSAEVVFCGAQELADQASMDQLRTVLAAHACITQAVVMPDIHAGAGAPVGVAYMSTDLMPKLIGTDIGCGMTLFATNMKYRASVGAKLAKRLQAATEELARPLPDVQAVLAQNGMDSTAHDDQLGTLGGGNHFAEFLFLDTVCDATAVASLGLTDKNLVLLVHSGSRGYGAAVAASFDAVLSDAATQEAYLGQHAQAVQWALANRMLLGHRVGTAAQCRVTKVLNIVHNYVEAPEGGAFLHRKGVGRVAPGQLSIIPGSRGARTYLVRATEDGATMSRFLGSLAHGAGRKVTRSKAMALLGHVANAKLQVTSPLGPGGPSSHVVCANGALLRQEHPDMYKDIDAVVEAMVGAGVVQVVATLVPVCTFKN